MSKFWTKNGLVRYFWAGTSKKLYPNFNIIKFIQLKNFGKNSLNLGPKMPYLSIFGIEYENNIVIFEIITIGFM